MRKAQTLEILVLAVTFACQGRNSFPCSESGKIVAFCESHSSQYFTQAKVNEKEMLECFSQSNIETLIWL